MDRFDSMSIVLAVAEAGSLSAAARRQKTPLATVSRKVSDLEAHLETKLFHRSTRALVPTDAGRAYIAAAKRILADIEETERAAAGEYATPRGDLIISAPVALGRFYLQPVVTEFLAAYPEVDIHLSLVDRSVNLVEEHVDLALRLGTLADSGLIAVRIGETSRVICASPQYLLSRGTPATPDDLATHDMISYPPLQTPSLWRFKQGETHYAVPVRSRLIVSNLEFACDAARAASASPKPSSISSPHRSDRVIWSRCCRTFSRHPFRSASSIRPTAICRPNCGPSWISRCRASRRASVVYHRNSLSRSKRNGRRKFTSYCAPI